MHCPDDAVMHLDFLDHSQIRQDLVGSLVRRNLFIQSPSKGQSVGRTCLGMSTDKFFKLCRAADGDGVSEILRFVRSTNSRNPDRLRHTVCTARDKSHYPAEDVSVASKPDALDDSSSSSGSYALSFTLRKRRECYRCVRVCNFQVSKKVQKFIHWDFFPFRNFHLVSTLVHSILLPSFQVGDNKGIFGFCHVKCRNANCKLECGQGHFQKA